MAGGDTTTLEGHHRASSIPAIVLLHLWVYTYFLEVNVVTGNKLSRESGYVPGVKRENQLVMQQDSSNLALNNTYTFGK